MLIRYRNKSIINKSNTIFIVRYTIITSINDGRVFIKDVCCIMEWLFNTYCKSLKYMNAIGH